MSSLVVAIAAFVCVAAAVGAVAMMMREKTGSTVEDRLDMLTGASTSEAAKQALLKGGSVLSQPLDDVPGFFDDLLSRFGNINLLFRQADTTLTVSRFSLICIIMGIAGSGMGAAMGIHFALLPLVGLFMGVLPLFWLLFRRKRRLKKFASQLPDALEMLSRAMRAGQSLAFGLNSVANEMPSPIGQEFGRVFEEQNLGIPLDDSLEALTERIPNLDLKFFATAVVLQRQTGGDLAEILDKIGGLIRERFQIWGQVQALTGEGRLSGIVLMALPVVLLLVVYQMNPTYVEVLFTDPLGKQMLAGAIFLQVVGALVIRQIVNIKV